LYRELYWRSFNLLAYLCRIQFWDCSNETYSLIGRRSPSLLEAAINLKPFYDLAGIAVNGAMLVSETLRLQPDVIVTDITMPSLTGIDAVIQLRKLGSSAKVVFLTVHSEKKFLEACMTAGASGVPGKTALRVSLTKSLVHGLQFLASYTLSKTLDTDGADINSTSSGNQVTLGDQNSPNGAHPIAS
jgi:CheY-like chemotaxis protein